MRKKVDRRWRGISYKRGGKRIQDLRRLFAERADKAEKRAQESERE